MFYCLHWKFFFLGRTGGRSWTTGSWCGSDAITWAIRLGAPRALALALALALARVVVARVVGVRRWLMALPWQRSQQRCRAPALRQRCVS